MTEGSIYGNEHDPAAAEAAVEVAPAVHVSGDDPEAERVEAEGGAFEHQCTIHFAMNAVGARAELVLPPGQDLDETNLCHVLSWYIQNAMGQLIPVAVQSWHVTRRAMLAQMKEQGRGEIEGLVTGQRLLGPDGKPV